MENKIQKYTLTAITLHWLVAILIFALFAIGLYMTGLPTKAELPPGAESLRKPWFELHKSLGITVFLLLMIRVYWRVTHEPPPLPDFISHAQQTFINIAHKLFYVSMILQPTSGLLSSSFGKYPIKWFGMPLPKLGWEDQSLKELFSDVHEISAVILATFIIIHLAGVAVHVLKGNGKTILQRMLP